MIMRTCHKKKDGWVRQDIASHCSLAWIARKTFVADIEWENVEVEVLVRLVEGTALNETGNGSRPAVMVAFVARGGCTLVVLVFGVI